MYNNICKFGDSIQRIKKFCNWGGGVGGMGMIFSVIAAYTFLFGTLASQLWHASQLMWRATADHCLGLNYGSIQIICHSGDIDWCKYYKWSKFWTRNQFVWRVQGDISWEERHTLTHTPPEPHCHLTSLQVQRPKRVTWKEEHGWKITLPK